MSTILLLSGLFILGIVLNGIFAGYETGFVSCNPVRVRHQAEKESNVKAKRLYTYLDQPDYLLTIVLLGTNLSLILGTLAITRLLGPLWATILATPLFLLFGEVLPKSMFRMHPTRFSLAFTPFIHLSSLLLMPLTLPVTWLSRSILSLVHGKEKSSLHLAMRSSEDVRVLVDESADRGTIEEEEKEMIHSVMDLQIQSAKEVMVPRINMLALPEKSTHDELLKLFMESGRTRIPIYGATIDTIVGMVSAFDVLRDTTPRDENIQRFVQPIMHVFDTMKLDDVLKAMRDAKQTMAIVTDEYGGTDGLITLEDILEEIFGEIQDEYDAEEAPIRRVGPNEFIINARTPLEEVAEFMEVDLEDHEVETFGGWLMHITGRIPQKGEVVRQDRFRITIAEGSRNAIARARLEILPEKAPQHEQEEI
jgi:putative hemolysin